MQIHLGYVQLTAIPKPTPSTLRAIQDAITASNDGFESVGIAAGDIGTECDRELWLKFRRASAPEEITWRTRRIFERGNIEEERLIDLLRAAGMEVTDQQARARDCGGHLRGKIDGQVMGVPEAPVKKHVLECKSAKAESFRKVAKLGVKEGNPKHYATMQFYMHKRGLERCLYMVTNKDDEDIYSERVHYDIHFASRSIARINRIIAATRPPVRLCGKPDDFRGALCRQHAVCWHLEMPRRHCRTCISSTPLMSGDADWDCEYHGKPLGLGEQEAGCSAHLFLPDLVPGVQVDYDAEARTVTYGMADGATWVDGLQESASEDLPDDTTKTLDKTW